jgi:hypothetical protein
MMHKIYSTIFIVLFVFAFSENFALAGSATLQWNANSETDLAGYRIYYGTSARTGTDPKTCTLCGYATKVDVGKVTTYTVSNLTNNTTYYFSVSAYDTSNNESAFSAQVSKLISKSADLDKDGIVGTPDFGILMSNWGSTTRPPADIDQDGFVGTPDFGIMMSQWGS